MTQINKKIVILISGPTATGKSDFALQLGQKLPIEIVNADIGSFYTQLTIGTAKPDWKSQIVPHHFFDVIDDATSWTAPQFREKLKGLIEEIWSRGNIPVVVGGSAFYIQSFFYKNHDIVSPEKETISSLEEQSAEDLWHKLYAVDPQRAEKIGITDHYRLVRALAIWQTIGQKPSTLQPDFDPLAPFCFITLNRDRDQLYDMINQRVHVMIEGGWLDEVQSFMHDELFLNFLLKKKMIGYDLLAQYLMGHLAQETFDDVVGLIQQRTRNYAKRQITFLKKLQENVYKDCRTHEKLKLSIGVVEECNLTLCDLSLYIKQLSERISQFLE